MIVERSNFESVVKELSSASRLSLDTETTSLRAHHGGRLFSIIIGKSKTEAFYFNWWSYLDLLGERVLSPSHLQALQVSLFNERDRLWFLHNAKFDMAMLANEGLSLKGKIHCTLAQGRVVYNEHFNYDLDSSLQRIGLKKDASVEAWIEANKAFEKQAIPGKEVTFKNKFYYKVPFDIISKYGLMDATGTFALGEFQLAEIEKQSAAVPEGKPTIRDVMENERLLTKTVFAMEQTGCLIDIEFCKKAIVYEEGRSISAALEFKHLTGEDYKASPLLFKRVFESEKEKWVYGEETKTGQINPSFESDVLRTFTVPSAQAVLTLRDSKAKRDFYEGFKYHADEQGRVHPSFNSHGTRHGRFSSSNPNFQNLKSDEEAALTEEFVVRRAIIPTPGFILCAIDFKAMEYYFMLEYACDKVDELIPLAKEVLEGKDVHQATAELANTTRSAAKTTNFLNLYGGGAKKLADGLKISIDEAYRIKKAINDAAPEVGGLIRSIIKTAETRGYIRNWLGRRCHFPNSEFAYTAPNYLIAGGCADVVKVGLNRLHEFLQDKKSRLILTIHDENVFEVAEDEIEIIPELKRIMETSYPSKWLPFVCSAYTSKKSLADLEEWK
jgi:DNA polymerase I-like protein with 3'-5' exonuclease and polymerase domains